MSSLSAASITDLWVFVDVLAFMLSLVPPDGFAVAHRVGLDAISTPDLHAAAP